MRRPPSLNYVLGYPITVGVAVLAIAATLRWWSGMDIEQFMLGCDEWWREPWRFLTPALFHGDLLHLLFNLYWLWLFGTQIEDEFGHGLTLGIYALLAAGSTAAERALFHGGVGLSGVNYGLFGLLLVLSRTDPRFRDAIDRQTVQLLVGWFFLCIVLTVMDVWGVANVAHGAGFILGALLGWTIAARDFLRRVRNAVVLGAAVLLCVAGGTVARPYVNLTNDIGQELAYSGYVALENGDTDRAIALYQRAVAIDPNMHNWWHNLAIAYYRLGQMDRAKEAFRRAAKLKPASTGDE